MLQLFGSSAAGFFLSISYFAVFCVAALRLLRCVTPRESITPPPPPPPPPPGCIDKWIFGISIFIYYILTHNEHSKEFVLRSMFQLHSKHTNVFNIILNCTGLAHAYSDLDLQLMDASSSAPLPRREGQRALRHLLGVCVRDGMEGQGVLNARTPIIKAHILKRAPYSEFLQ